MTMYVSETIRALKPYLPGKPIEETKREFGLEHVVKLASNENPLGPSPLAKKAIEEALSELHRYPDGSAFELKKELAKKLNLSSAEMILGNGSNEVIDFVVRAYTQPGEFIAQPQYSFVAYSICGLIHGVKTVTTPIDSETFEPDLKVAAEMLENPSIKVFFLANPNNPTGAYVSKEKVFNFLQTLNSVRPNRDLLVVLDYAYAEYLTEGLLPSIQECIERYPNVLITQTFSKIYGLGGLRVGYLYGPKALIDPLEKVRQPFNLNSLALAGCVAALKDEVFKETAILLNSKARTFWENELSSHGVPFVKGFGNFVLVRVKEPFGLSGVELFEKCLRQGLILRPLSNYGLHDWIRISFGTESENHFAWNILNKLRIHKVSGLKNP